jgi:hypothetical protein
VLSAAASTDNVTLGIRMRIEFENPTCTPPQLRPVQAAYHAFDHAAKCGEEGGTKIENSHNSHNSHISSSDFSDVGITTNNGIAKNSAVTAKKA